MKGGWRRSLIRDARGAVVVYVAIVVPVLFGVGAMALDIGRLITLHTELQAAADGAAIAGARELDRFPGAIAKAKEAAALALANIQTFATGAKPAILDTTTLQTDCGPDPALGTACIRFLRSLPLDDGAIRGDDRPITATDYIDPTVETQDERDKEARFIDVHIGARDVSNILVRLLVLFGQGLVATSTTSATAIAGQDQVFCNIPPMFICNPTETPGNTDLNQGVDFAAIKGHEIRLFKQGPGGPMTPGNFGLLCPLGSEGEPGGCGAKSIRDALASNEGSCIGKRKVTTKTGLTLGMVRAGINARLDHFEQQAKTADNIPWRTLDGTPDPDGNPTLDFTPAGNVTQGATPPNNTATSKTNCEYTKPKGVPKLNTDAQTVDEWIAADPINNTKKNFDPDHVASAAGFLRDRCFYDGTPACDFRPQGCLDASCGTSRVGDGVWAYNEFFRINHGCNSTDCKPADWPATADWPPSRFEIYRYELERGSPDNIVIPQQNIFKNGSDSGYKTAENGHKQCFQPNSTPPSYPIYNYFPDKVNDLRLLKDRRIMSIAIANCQAIDALEDENTKGKFSFKIPELIFVFLAEPMREPSDSEIFAEMLGPLDEGAEKALVHDVVQIYRR